MYIVSASSNIFPIVQMSVKPRLVVAYPGQHEDALLEGYWARYTSDKVNSVTLDLYTQGTLKTFLDLAVKGQFTEWFQETMYSEVKSYNWMTVTKYFF